MLKKKCNKNIYKILVILMVLSRFMLPLKLLINAKVLYFLYYGSFLIILIGSFIDGRTKFIRRDIEHLLIFFSFVWFVLIRTLLNNRLDISFYSPMNNVISLINFFSIYYIFLMNNNKRLEYSLINLIFLLSIIITAIYSIYYVETKDYLAIRTGSGYDFGVADFSYITTLTFIPLILIDNIKNSKFPSKLFYILLYILVLLLILKSNFMTSIILYIFTSFIAIFPTEKKMKRSSKIVIYIFIIMILTTFIKLIVPSIMLTLVKSGRFSWVLEKKIIAIINLLQGSFDDLETLGIRINRIILTLNTFFKNPVIGVSYSDYNSSSIGGHAQWFDDIARYGIIGFLLWFNILKRVFENLKNTLENKRNGVGVKTILSYILLGFLNPNLNTNLLLFIFIILPNSLKTRKELA